MGFATAKGQVHYKTKCPIESTKTLLQRMQISFYTTLMAREIRIIEHGAGKSRIDFFWRCPALLQIRFLNNASGICFCIFAILEIFSAAKQV